MKLGLQKIGCIGGQIQKYKRKSRVFNKYSKCITLEIKHFFLKLKQKSVSRESFGPINLNKNSSTYGKILEIPKANWGNYNLLEQLKVDHKITIYLYTDVNIACLTKHYYGAIRNVNSYSYNY